MLARSRDRCQECNPHSLGASLLDTWFWWFWWFWCALTWPLSKLLPVLTKLKAFVPGRQKVDRDWRIYQQSQGTSGFSTLNKGQSSPPGLKDLIVWDIALRVAVQITMYSIPQFSLQDNIDVQCICLRNTRTAHSLFVTCSEYPSSESSNDHNFRMSGLPFRQGLPAEKKWMSPCIYSAFWPF